MRRHGGAARPSRLLGGGRRRRVPAPPDGAEQRLHVSPADNLADVFLTTGFPYHRAENGQQQCGTATFLRRAQGIRCLGASAMDFAFVATGALGGYWEGWLKPWDAAPGALLVREAGGRVTNYDGDEWGLHDQTVVASNGQPRVHQALLDGVREARADAGRHADLSRVVALGHTPCATIGNGCEIARHDLTHDPEQRILVCDR